MKNYNSHSLITYCIIKNTLLLTILLPMMFLVSCEKVSDKNDETEQKIPIDSISFTCKINNEIIEFKSPQAQFSSWKKSWRRLYKVQNNSKDSVLIEYTQKFGDDKYYIEYGFCNSFLLDTMNIRVLVPNVKEYLFQKGTYPFQYLSFRDGLDETTLKSCGFHISICDIKNEKNYTSNTIWYERANTVEYNDFKAKSAFQINNSFRLDSTTTSENSLGDISDIWFLKANFNCKMYECEWGTINEVVYLSQGFLNVCF